MISEHYTKADELLDMYNKSWQGLTHDRRMELLAQAQAHATLAGISGVIIPFTVPAEV